MAAHVIQLPRGRVEVEERAGFLFIVEQGELRDLRELEAYIAQLEKLIEKTGLRRAIIDARGERGDPPADVRRAMWDWLAAPNRGLSQVAFVLPSEMAVARVNMTALSQKAPVRAFDSVQQAQRWLLRPVRPSQFGMAPVSGPPGPPSTPPSDDDEGGSQVA